MREHAVVNSWSALSNRILRHRAEGANGFYTVFRTILRLGQTTAGAVTSPNLRSYLA